MTPRGGTQRHGVVIRHSAEVKAIVRQLVPLFARDLACFAADTNGGVGKEAFALAVLRHYPPSSRAISRHAWPRVCHARPADRDRQRACRFEAPADRW